MQYRITLEAGVEKRQVMSGKTLLLLDTGAASELDITIEIGNGYAAEKLRNAKRGLKVQAPGGFTSILLKSPIACVVEVVASAANISVNLQEGMTVNANILGVPAVQIVPAASMQDIAQVEVTAAGQPLVAANASRKRLIFTNLGAGQVAIGFTGITWAKRCIVIAKDESWIETDAANLAWAAICDAGATASITIQEVLV